MTFTTHDLFWERLGVLLSTIGITPPNKGDPLIDGIDHIDDAIAKVELHKELIRRLHLLSEEDGA